jgi:hypothetical protein
MSRGCVSENVVFLRQLIAVSISQASRKNTNNPRGEKFLFIPGEKRKYPEKHKVKQSSLSGMQRVDVIGP